MISPDVDHSASRIAPEEGDHAVIRRCLDGDQQAWALLIDRYQRLVYSVPRRLGFDQDAAEEVFQDVFAALVRQLPRLRNEQALPKWLMTTAYRISVQQLRRRRQTMPEVDVADPVDEAPVDRLIRWEEQHRVDDALGRLGSPCRELLRALYGGAGPPRYDEVSSALGMPVGSIGPTRARCLRKLLEILEAGNDGPGGP